MVDTNSEHYKVAREYMIRLNRQDLEDPDAARQLADAAGMQPEEFVQRFSPVIAADVAERVTPPAPSKIPFGAGS